MKLKTIKTLPEMQSLAQEWNALLKESASDVPFLRHEYLTTWWQTLGGGEWPQGLLHVITVHLDDDHLVGIAPLFHTTNRDGETAFMLLGSIEISDYLDLIARPNDLTSFIEVLLDHLDSPAVPDWQVLDFYNFLESSPTLPALKAAVERRGWRYQQEPLQHCPFIPLPGDWEQYLAEQVDKKQRHEIRRKIRRAESHDLPIRWHIVKDDTALDQEMDDFLNLMAQDVNKERFLTEAMRSQMHASARAAFQAGWLQLSFMEVGGEKAAGYLNFDYNNHLWVYNSGLNFGFYELSPGWVLLGYLLQWANENQRTSFDFMRGDEEYKYRFGAIDRRVMRVLVRRS